MKNKICNNYFSGPVNQVSNCLEIILYNKFLFSDRISLYNLSEFYLTNLTGTSDKYVKIIRENYENGFEYKKQLENGFNIIVYISSISNSPLGYSEFVNTQGVGVSLEIYLNISRTLKGELDLILENKLNGKDLSKNYLGEEPYQYVSRKTLTERSYRNLFTSDIARLESDHTSFIVGSSGVTTKDGRWRLRIKSPILEEGYSNYNICFYNGSLMLATWSGKNYALYTLVGDQEKISGSTISNIKRIEGRYYRDTEEKLRKIENGDIVEKTKKNQFCDFTSKRCKVYNLPTFYIKSDILKYIPEINNIYLDLDNYLRSNQADICSKIGSWYIFERDFGGSVIYTAVSPTSVINMAEEDLRRSLFVGDQTMILMEKDDDKNPYYVLYNSEGTVLSTERAREIMLNGQLRQWKIDNTPGDDTDDSYSYFKFCFLDTEEDDLHFSEYYGENGLVSLIFGYEELYNTVLGKYRRSYYPECDGIPELIGSYGGLIFYKNGNKICVL